MENITPRRAAKQPPDGHIDGEAFQAALAKWASTPVLQQPRISNDITGRFFYPLATGYVHSHARGHLEAEDLIQDCVLSCYRKMRFYKPSAGSAFNFFTKVCENRCKVLYSMAALDKRRISRECVPINDDLPPSAPPARVIPVLLPTRSPLEIMKGSK